MTEVLAPDFADTPKKTAADGAGNAKPRQTKAELLRKMLSRKSGTGLDALCTATGWQPHSVRAAMSGLRKAGYIIDRMPAKKEGAPPTYRITAAPAAGA
jgi:hypothetical protein